MVLRPLVGCLAPKHFPRSLFHVLICLLLLNIIIGALFYIPQVNVFDINDSLDSFHTIKKCQLNNIICTS